MAKALIKRSVTLMGHQTSLSLEPVFWEALAQAAAGTPQTQIDKRIQ